MCQKSNKVTLLKIASNSLSQKCVTTGNFQIALQKQHTVQQALFLLLRANLMKYSMVRIERDLLLSALGL